jgi:cardiolipin synthase
MASSALQMFGADAPTPGVDRAAQGSVTLVDGGGEAYPRMLQAIAGARRSVHLEMYSFAKTGTGALFVDALADAAGRAVAVVVHVDGWGSAYGGREIAAALREAGCTVRIHNRLRTLMVARVGRNHRKVLLVDDEVAFIGGINIGDENLSEGVRVGWADVAVEIRGPPCRGLARMIRRKSHVLCHGPLRIDWCGLGGGWRLRRQYLQAIAGARHRIDLAHAYFLPDRGIVRALTRASRRGVAVRLLLPGRSDILFARAATRARYRRLLAAGIQIREWEGSVLHAKVATIDGRHLLIGSFNLDPFSLVNREALVQVVDHDVVERGQAWIADYFARSRAITSAEASSRLHRWLFEPLGYLVALVAARATRMIARRSRRQVPRDNPSSWSPGVMRERAGKTPLPGHGPTEDQQ